MFFTKEMLLSYAEMITERIGNLKDMNELSMVESILLQFCTENDLDLPVEVYDSENTDSLFKTNFLFEQLVGGDEYEKLKARNKLREEISSIIKKYCSENCIIKRENKSRLYVRGINDNDITEYLRKIKGYSALKADVLAVIEERGLSEWFNYTDLWFTTEGIAIVKEDRFPSRYTSYDKVTFSENEIKCGNEKYINAEDVNITVLRDMIMEIGRITAGHNAECDIRNSEFSYHCFEAFGGDTIPLLSINV